MTYDDGRGRPHPIPIVEAPLVLQRDDYRYLLRLTRAFADGHRRIAAARAARDPAVRALLPVTRAEERWIALSPPGSLVAACWDMNIDPRDGGARTARLFEMNGCAVGGIHYATVCAEIARTHLAPRLAIPPSMREAWLELLQARRARPRIAWLEDRTWTAGITEGPTLCAYLRERGWSAVVADPRDLRFRRGVLHAGDQPVDVVYRGIELADLVAIEAEERRPLAALRQAARRGLVLSSFQGDLDHKSLLEIFSSPRFARLFTPAQRRDFRAHVPWTRLLGARASEDADGRPIDDLVGYARSHRTELVLKPNRSCGGEGILIGHETPASRWNRAVSLAATGKAPAVVQAVIDSARLEGTPHYTTYGLFPGLRRLGVLGRAAPFRVVNVARGGGLAGVLVRP